MPRRRDFTALIALLFAACVTPPEGLPPLGLRTLERPVHFTGSPLSGPVEDALEPGSPADAWPIELQVLELPELPATALEPLGVYTRLVFRVEDTAILGAASSLISGARVGFVENRAALLEELGLDKADLLDAPEPRRGVLAEGTSVRFSLGWAHQTTDREPRRLERLDALVHLRREGEHTLLECGLSLDEDSLADETSQGITELILFDPFPLDGARQIGLIIPAPFEARDPRALVLLLTIESPPEPGSAGFPQHLAEFARALGDLARSRREAEQNRKPLEVSSEAPEPFELGLAALHREAKDRGALYFLARTCEAPLVADLALCATDQCHDKLLTVLRLSTQELPKPADTATIGWMIEKIAIDLLLENILERRATQAERAILIRHLGGVAMRVTSLRELVQTAHDLESMHAYLREENLMLLADSSLAVRTRAHDWLAARELAPPDYDPFTAGARTPKVNPDGANPSPGDGR